MQMRCKWDATILWYERLSSCSATAVFLLIDVDAKLELKFYHSDELSDMYKWQVQLTTTQTYPMGWVQ